MNGYYGTPPVEESSDTGIIVIVIVIVVIIIIALAVYFFYFSPTGRLGGFTWNIITGHNTSAESFSASAGNAFLVSPAATGTFSLQLVPPVAAVGQEFAVLHGGPAIVAISVAGTVVYNLPPRTSQTFVWLSQNTFSLI
jgi:hypothetical protein